MALTLARESKLVKGAANEVKARGTLHALLKFRKPKRNRNGSVTAHHPTISIPAWFIQQEKATRTPSQFCCSFP